MPADATASTARPSFPIPMVTAAEAAAARLVLEVVDDPLTPRPATSTSIRASSRTSRRPSRSPRTRRSTPCSISRRGHRRRRRRNPLSRLCEIVPDNFTIEFENLFPQVDKVRMA
jgi:hypothetical protein